VNGTRFSLLQGCDGYVCVPATLYSFLCAVLHSLCACVDGLCRALALCLHACAVCPHQPFVHVAFVLHVCDPSDTIGTPFWTPAFPLVLWTCVGAVLSWRIVMHLAAQQKSFAQDMWATRPYSC
jgi:hypothetical protein